jgi:lipopolysaccharide/colanic/teichoic acid biosynthesis glycosyltransferase
LKRALDIATSFMGLLLLGPVLIFIAWRIRRTDGGPIFYRGNRIGLYGQPFRIFKFRTMIADADKVGGSSTSDDDARITDIGRVLRKYKLDELPQLLNVLRGEMSIVGPRPEVQMYTDLFTMEEKLILSVRPGITDWASIWNADEGAALAGATDPEAAYMERIRPIKLKLQLKYVRERSFWMDVKIIFLTVLAILRPESQAVRDIRTGNTGDVGRDQ